MPIIGEQLLDCLDMLVPPAGEAVASVGALPLIVGAVSAFLSGLFACKVMIAIVKKAKLGWFALYCAVIGVAILVFGF